MQASSVDAGERLVGQVMVVIDILCVCMYIAFVWLRRVGQLLIGR